MVFKLICESLILPPSSPDMKHSKRGGCGKQLSLVFHLFIASCSASCLVADQSQETSSLLRRVTCHCFPFYSLSNCCYFVEDSGVREAGNRKESKLTVQKRNIPFYEF